MCAHTHTCVCDYVCGMSTYVMHVCTFVGGNAHLAHSQPHSVEIQSHLIWSFDGDQLAPAVLLSRSLSLIAVGLQLGAVTPGCLYRCWRFKLRSSCFYKCSLATKPSLALKSTFDVKRQSFISCHHNLDHLHT